MIYGETLKRLLPEGFFQHGDVEEFAICLKNGTQIWRKDGRLWVVNKSLEGIVPAYAPVIAISQAMQEPVRTVYRDVIVTVHPDSNSREIELLVEAAKLRGETYTIPKVEVVET